MHLQQAISGIFCCLVAVPKRVFSDTQKDNGTCLGLVKSSGSWRHKAQVVDQDTAFNGF